MFLLRWFETMIRNLTVHIFLPIIGCEVLQRFGQCLVRLEWKLQFYLWETKNRFASVFLITAKCVNYGIAKIATIML